MSCVRGKDTSPELAVRHLIHHLGFRYRLHVRGLPGTPDLVFPGRRKIIFIHGCFWHGHACRAGRKAPRSNMAYWASKLQRNRNRDRRVQAQLRRSGWNVLSIWECQIRTDVSSVIDKITHFLGRYEQQ
jgi:DNA mismatch endonuclease, patch repair protein